jgi:hypothetical protein
LAEESRALPRPDWTAIGASVPDRDPARAAEELCREVSAWILYAHCLRSYLFAVLLGREDGMSHDEEALYVACLLHDVGLTPAYDDPIRPLEHVSADVAVSPASSRGWPTERQDNVHRAMVLHVAAEVAASESPESILLSAGVSCDVTGTRVEEVERRARDEILHRLPPGPFKRGFAGMMRREAARKPQCAAAALIDGGLLDRIAAAPFDEPFSCPSSS